MGSRVRDGGDARAETSGSGIVGGSIFMMPFAGDPGYGYTAILPPHSDPARRRFRQLCLPGHGERLKEPLLNDLDSMAADLFRQIADQLRPHDVFFGHSMGALLAWLVMRRARTLLFPLPRAVVLSGMRAPSALIARGRHVLSRDDLRAELRRLGGSPDLVLNDDEVFRFFEPQVRADFEAVETYRYRAEPPLASGAIVLLGASDDVSAKDGEAWGREFVAPPQVVTMSGGHFFILQHAAAIRERLLGLLSGNWSLADEAAR